MKTIEKFLKGFFILRWINPFYYVFVIAFSGGLCIKSTLIYFKKVYETLNGGDIR